MKPFCRTCPWSAVCLSELNYTRRQSFVAGEATIVCDPEFIFSAFGETVRTPRAVIRLSKELMEKYSKGGFPG